MKTGASQYREVQQVYFAEPHHPGYGAYIVSHKIFLPNWDFELIPVSGECNRTIKGAKTIARELNYVSL